MNFLAQMYQELPVITPVGLITADGQTLTESELNEEQQEWLWKYETFNYCGMIDLFDEARPFFCRRRTGSRTDRCGVKKAEHLK